MPKLMQSKYPGKCVTCGNSFPEKTWIVWREKGKAEHQGCANKKQTQSHKSAATVKAIQAAWKAPVNPCRACGSPYGKHSAHCSTLTQKVCCFALIGGGTKHSTYCSKYVAPPKPAPIVAPVIKSKPVAVIAPTPVPTLGVKNPPKGVIPERPLPTIFAACITVADVERVVMERRVEAGNWKAKGNVGAVKDVMIGLEWDLKQASQHPRFKGKTIPTLPLENAEVITAAALEVW